MSSRRGRPAHPDVLTPAEWRVVEGIREGRTNGEIADALGVSVNTVRYHVSNILSKTGLSDRNALAAWERRPRRFRIAWPLPLAGALAGGGTVALGGVVVWAIVMLQGVSGGEAGGFDTRASSAEYLFYDAADLERSGLVDAGHLLENEDGAPFGVMYRPGWSGVRSHATTWVADSEVPGGAWGYGTLGWSSTLAAGFTKTIDGVKLYVSVHHVNRFDDFRLDQALVRRGGTSQIAFLPHDGEVLVRVDVTDAERRRFPAVIDAVGHLWVALDASIEDEEVVADDTGEAIDVSGMTRLADFYGGVPHNPNYTLGTVFCREGDCDVTLAVTTGPMHAPLAGLLECAHSEDGSDRPIVRITTDDAVLELQPLMRSDPWRDEDCDGFPRQVDAGEALPFYASYWNLRAWDSEGNRLDVVQSRGRAIYLGDARPQVACPPAR